ncbi:MAG TPA: hypothetical protein VFV58_25820, partial [Blastocatellia bacterium]|nr:hypothetical protein [Blastocatellia bacterium]
MIALKERKSRFWKRRRPCLQASQLATPAGKGACAYRIAIFVLSARSWFLLRSGLFRLALGGKFV